MAQAYKRPRLALRLLKDSINAMRGRYLIFLLVIASGALANLLPPQLYKLFFHSIEAKDSGALYKLVVFGAITALASMITTGLMVYAREWLRCEMEANLRKNVLGALTRTSLQQLESVNRGEWIACTSGDLIVTEDFLTMSFPDQLRNLLMFIGSCLLFLYYGGIFGALLLLLAVLLIFFNIYIQKKMQPALDDIRDLHGNVYQQLLENFEGLRTIRSFGGEQAVQKNFAQHLTIINKKSLRIMRPFASLIGTNEVFILAGMTAVLALILQKVSNNAMSFDDALVYPFYMGIFFSSVAGFYRSNFDWTMFFTKGARLANLIYNFGDEKSTISQSKNPVFDEKTSTLSFREIDLKYPNHPPLAPLFDLCIKKHELFGIVGTSGCGKSTLLEFLAGLRPLDVNGVSCLLPTSLAAYVEQKPYIFEGSVADNLRFGCNHHASDEQLIDALQKTRLTDRFMSRGGLNFRVYERGQNLSEGERYRLGIARAILSSKPFLLMDEPFAALDNASIAAIVTLVQEERVHRGVVIVTHYVPTQLQFDRILDFADFYAPPSRERAAQALHNVASFS